jgi:hypothetical protein
MYDLISYDAPFYQVLALPAPIRRTGSGPELFGEIMKRLAETRKD